MRELRAEFGIVRHWLDSSLGGALHLWRLFRKQILHVQLSKLTVIRRQWSHRSVRWAREGDVHHQVGEIIYYAVNVASLHDRHHVGDGVLRGDVTIVLLDLLGQSLSHTEWTKGVS